MELSEKMLHGKRLLHMKMNMSCIWSSSSELSGKGELRCVVSHEMYSIRVPDRMGSGSSVQRKSSIVKVDSMGRCFRRPKNKVIVARFQVHLRAFIL